MLSDLKKLWLEKGHFISCLIFLVFPTLLQAQQELTGKVYAAKDSTTLAAVSVYFDGTSIGTTTNLEGAYSIRRDGSGDVPLVIRFMGYNAVTIEHIPKDLRELPAIYLQEKQEQLDEVILQPDPWSREKKMKLFKKEFLGITKEAQEVSIQNEEVLKLYYNPAVNVLTAYADEPLIIINRHLGYEIEYNLQLFKAELKKNNFGGIYTYSVYYEGTSFFKEFKDREKPRKKHILNRRRAYFGSSLHFMRALAERQLTENNFDIYHKRLQVPPYQYFEINPEDQRAEINVLTDTLVLLYDKHKQSGLLASETFSIDNLGNHSPPQAISFSGEMALSRIALLLPLDYNIYNND